MADHKGPTTRFVVGPLPFLTLEDRCSDYPQLQPERMEALKERRRSGTS
jgi:hypothetical protein